MFYGDSMENTPAGHADGSSTNGHSSPIWTSEKPRCWVCAAGTRTACSCRGDSASSHSGAGLWWTAQNWYSAFSQPWITPWFLLRNKDLSVLTGGQLAPCALLLWSLMVVDRRVFLTPHLVVPHQLQEKDLPALSPCPTLREVIGVGLQRSTLYMGALESCSLKKLRTSSLPWGPIFLARCSMGMWLCPPHLVWSQTQEHIPQPTLYTHLKPPPMLSSVPEDTFSGLQAATSPLPDSLALKQTPCFEPLPRALAQGFPNPAYSWPA